MMVWRSKWWPICTNQSLSWQYLKFSPGLTRLELLVLIRQSLRLCCRHSCKEVVSQSKPKAQSCWRAAGWLCSNSKGSGRQAGRQINEQHESVPLQALLDGGLAVISRMKHSRTEPDWHCMTSTQLLRGSTPGSIQHNLPGSAFQN